MSILPFLMACHLCGDFLLQNDWMQAKGKNSFVCTVHVACYSIPFWLVAFKLGVPYWAVVVILLEHWAQDRFGLHLKWMKAYKQSTPDKWPVGPLCIDQAMHVTFIAIVCLLWGIK